MSKSNSKKPAYKTYRTLRGAEAYRDKLRAKYPGQTFIVNILDFKLWAVAAINPKTGRRIGLVP